ncbi:9465_t:CDS:2, partial [Rhizophagus irregularis]
VHGNRKLEKELDKKDEKIKSLESLIEFIEKDDTHPNPSMSNTTYVQPAIRSNFTQVSGRRI